MVKWCNGESAPSSALDHPPTTRAAHPVPAQEIVSYFAESALQSVQSVQRVQSVQSYALQSLQIMQSMQ